MDFKKSYRNNIRVLNGLYPDSNSFDPDQACSESKLFAKATSKQQKVPLICKELCVFQSFMKMLLLKNYNLRMAWPRYSFAV